MTDEQIITKEKIMATTKEEREKKRKQTAKEREQKQARILKKSERWLKGIPSRMKARDEKLKADRSTRDAKRKSQSERTKARIAATEKRRADAKAAKAAKAAKVVKTPKTTTTEDKSFGAKFKEKRADYLKGKGPKTFYWDGKEYHTRWKGESSEEQSAKRKKADGEDYQKFVSRKYGGGKV